MLTFWLLLCGEINYHLSSINNYDASFNKFCSLRDELIHLMFAAVFL